MLFCAITRQAGHYAPRLDDEKQHVAQVTFDPFSKGDGEKEHRDRERAEGEVPLA